MLCVLYVPPRGQSETWAVVCLIVQFTKFVVCCLSSNSSLYGLGFNPRVHKQFQGAIFLSCFPSAISLVLLSSLDLPFVVLGPESHLATYFMWVCPCLGPSDWGVKKCSGEWPCSPGTTHVCNPRGSFPSLRVSVASVVPCYSHCCSHLCNHDGHSFGAGAWEKGEKRKRGICPHCVWALGDPFRLLSWSGVPSLTLLVPTPTPRSSQGILEGRKC